MSSVTISKLQRYRKENRKITMLTAYDVAFARLIDAAEIDMILVGDSLGMVMQGRPNTVGVSLDDVIYHTQCVARGVQYSHIIADLPFMSYQVSPEQALENSGRLLQEGGAQSVKLEGGLEMVATVERLSQSGIPVMAHIGLKPQRVHQMGGFVSQGKTPEARALILKEARAFQNAGAYALLLEGIPTSLAKEITEEVEIPTIGIGAGVHCSGQVLVIHDLLGMDQHFNPKFAKRYAELHQTIRQAILNYKEDVLESQFPAQEHGIGE